MNLKMTLAYDGTSYFGWQTADGHPSIEDTLQTILEKILQQKTPLQAASRTDAGVHAEGQVVNFVLEKERDLGRLYKSLNQLLPRDIRVVDLKIALDDFHPTLDAKSKEYHYYLSHTKIQSPFERLFSWHCPFFPLDIKKIKTAASLFLGKHDFQALSNTTSEKPKNTVCTLYRLDTIFNELSLQPLRFEIHGNRFLYKMVRNLVGTLIGIGRGTLSLDTARKLIEGKIQRAFAGITAPAHGLILKKVMYDS